MNAAELKYLIGLCDREIGYCGLDTAPGRAAKHMKDKLNILLQMLSQQKKAKP